MRELQPIDHELLRKAILRYLAMHHPAGFTADSLAATLPYRGLIDFAPTIETTTSALALLKDLALITSVTSPVGSSVYYNCTAKGKLEIERETI